MAKDSGSGQASGGGDARLLLNAQYIKDLSFENPNAPLIYGELQQGPNIEITINVDLENLQERLYEVVLAFQVSAKVGEQTAFIVELEFAALATLGEGISEPDGNRLLLTEVPRLLFPFARAVVSDVTRDGGFPPLLINPIDFEELYRSRQENDARLAETGST
jgi:preprotein translocase subunit SecB